MSRWFVILALGLSLPASAARAAEPGQAVASRGPLVVEQRVPGWLEARDAQPIGAPRLSGLERYSVSRVVASGQAVEAGQVVVGLDPAEAAWQLRQAQGQLGLAEARLAAVRARLAAERLERELGVDRAQYAVERAGLKAQAGVGLAPRLAVERAGLDRKAAKLELSQAREALGAHQKRAEALTAERQLAVTRAQQSVDQARAALEALRLTASAAGRVRLAPGVEPGAVVRTGQPLAEVLRPGRPVGRFRVSVDPRTAFRPKAVGLSAPARGRARVGAEIVGTRLPAPGPGPQPDQLELLVAPTGEAHGLQPGEPAELVIRLLVDEQALLVPAQAVVSGPDGPVVWCLESPAGYRRVTTGRRTPELVQILTGLSEGERVSLDPRAHAQAASGPAGPAPAAPRAQEATP